MVMQSSCPLVASQGMIERWSLFCNEPKAWMNVALDKVSKLIFVHWTPDHEASGLALAAIDEEPLEDHR